jgi:hypothetical protein
MQRHEVGRPIGKELLAELVGGRDDQLLALLDPLVQRFWVLGARERMKRTFFIFIVKK